ncbi:protein GVQW3 [Trichonephila clavipes]|uniref:Protein GVQW3 n=1 Tax=Trichonephila clavipes TaxID=2585209 RepID=A0A8X6V5Q9_TRICX|nr:protein GVQW3 [Trichonephila clavipes]
MCNEKKEQSINLKFLVKLKKTRLSAINCCKWPMTQSSISCACFEWCKLFSKGRESTEDDQRPGRPVTVSTPETATKINHIVRADRRMCNRMIAESLNADKETARKILHMTKVCAKLVAKNLTPDQNLLR